MTLPSLARRFARLFQRYQLRILAFIIIAIGASSTCAQTKPTSRPEKGDDRDLGKTIEALSFKLPETTLFIPNPVFRTTRRFSSYPPRMTDNPGSVNNASESSFSLERNFPKNLLLDQKAIWTSPFHTKVRDLRWIVPTAILTGGLISSDRDTAPQLRRRVNIDRAQQFSDAGLIGAMAVYGSIYAWGRVTKNPHARETGVLTGEALVNSLIVSEALKAVLGRQRPLEGDRAGNFFHSGSSFPSGHAMFTWTVASVIAHEYPGVFTKIGVYGLASAVSAARVAGGKHFASDVVIGGAMGWFIGRQVFKAHHDPQLGGANIGTFVRDVRDMEDGHTQPKASVYVPIESTSYQLFDRLIAAGFIHSAFMDLRPWTRAECARLLEEANGNFAPGSDPQYVAIYEALRKEFSDETERGKGARNPSLVLEELYARGTVLSGTPLRDSFHFGQTLYNDYGRPYWEGMNGTAGFVTSGTAGPFVFHLRGEYEHAPAGRSADTIQIRQFIANADLNPIRPVPPFPEVNRFRILEGYAALGWKNIQFTLGKQSLWWGPGESGPLLFSNNAEPIYMVRFSQTEPVRLPWIFSWLGPMRWDSYFGKLAGHQFPAAPYTHGQKVTFKPTRNFEMGYSRTVVLAGRGRPLTLGSFGRSLISVGNKPGDVPGGPTDVGDRRGGFDFSYRVPLMREFVTIFGDFMTDDDPSPISSPRRSIMSPGIYVSRLPGLRRMDFRFEAPTSAQSAVNRSLGRFFYFNGAYHDGYTNDGNIIGSWIGRQAKGLYAKSQYFISPTSILAFTYRNTKLDPNFVPQGGTLHDGKIGWDVSISKRTTLSSFVQYEQWNIPLLKAGVQKNVTASFEFRFRPSWTWK